ncbi:unnamed protein product [Amoebophrya sp. A120]|nr:unnamed protein product [Amoebophrya sp. A120]|eukprot:GSA120T00004661001.1
MSPPIQHVPGYKVVLLGDASVGKSSLVTRFVNNRFSDNSEATVGAAFSAQIVTTEEGQQVKFEIWDTAGQERFRSLAPMYYRGAACAIVVFDVSQEPTLDKAKDWVDELRQNVQDSEFLVIALAANKIDLRSDVGRKALEYAREEGLLYAETSAKTGAGVRNLFDELARTVPEMVRRKEIEKSRQSEMSSAAHNLDGFRVGGNMDRKKMEGFGGNNNNSGGFGAGCCGAT